MNKLAFAKAAGVMFSILVVVLATIVGIVVAPGLTGSIYYYATFSILCAIAGAGIGYLMFKGGLLFRAIILDTFVRLYTLFGGTDKEPWRVKKCFKPSSDPLFSFDEDIGSVDENGYNVIRKYYDWEWNTETKIWDKRYYSAEQKFRYSESYI